MAQREPLDFTVWKCGPPPATGQRQRYPGRFMYNMHKTYLAGSPLVLHMFSGSLKGDLRNHTTDIRPDSAAMFVAPYDQLPLPDGRYDVVIADPPYCRHFSDDWKQDYPKPKRILLEAARVAKPGGLVLLLHILVVPAYQESGCRRTALHPVLAGPNNVIRVLNVFRKAN